MKLDMEKVLAVVEEQDLATQQDMKKELAVAAEQNYAARVVKERNYLEEMRRLRTFTDPEIAHAEADGILTDVLLDLGYKELVEAYEAVWKWYS